MRRSLGKSSDRRKHVSFTTQSTVRSSKAKKTRVKETRETKRLFEAIARKLVEEHVSSANRKVEETCHDMVSRRITELRHDMVVMDSALTTRLTEVENKMNETSTKLNAVTNDLLHQNSLLRDDLSKLSKDCTAGLETERAKRLNGLKKVQMHEELTANECKAMLSSSNADVLRSVGVIAEDMKVQSKEIAKLKETVDDM